MANDDGPIAKKRKKISKNNIFVLAFMILVPYSITLQ